MLTHLRSERVEDWASETEIDHEQGVIRNLLLCGNTSRNGYVIPPKAFGNGARVKDLYGGRLIYLNHSDKDPTRRRVEEAAGIIIDADLVDGKPRGAIQAFKETENGKLLLAIAAAKRPPKGMGLSHVARYRFNEGLTEVESVEECVSVDLVTSPATTNTLREQESVMTLEALQSELDTVRKERAEFKTKLDEATAQLTAAKAEQAEAKTKLDAANTQLTAQEAELKTLRDKVDGYVMQEQVAARKAAALDEIKAAGLNPEDTVQCSEHFLNSVCGLVDAEARKAAIADRVALVEQAVGRKPTPTSQERTPAPKGQAFDPAKVEIVLA